MKMKELEARTGVGREAIRFYIREGLLPEPERPKRNVAAYREEHVVRIKAIKRLQEERFLPLSVIKALLNADRGAQEVDVAAFPGLEALLAARLDDPSHPAPWPLAEVVAQSGLAEAKLREHDRIGLISIRREADGVERVDARDVAIALRWGEMERAGLSPERGFTPDESRIYVEVIQWLAREEIRLFYSHMANAVDEAEAALAAERGITLINEVLGLLRTRTILTELKALTARHGRLRETPPPPTPPSPNTPVSASNDNDSKDPLGE